MSSRDPAPGRLELVQQFVNTHDYEDGSEELATPEALRAWLAERGLMPPDAHVSESDRARAIEVREALRALCLANNGLDPDPAAVPTLNDAAKAVPVVLRFDDGDAAVVPAGSGVPGALAALLAIVHRAMVEGTWSRLKTCPADDCLWAFYDHSKNHSGHWCTMAVCGNRAKARSYRERRKAEA
jgi:predicted RNA-binding Zn ribbon-like protein